MENTETNEVSSELHLDRIESHISALHLLSQRKQDPELAEVVNNLHSDLESFLLVNAEEYNAVIKYAENADESLNEANENALTISATLAKTNVKVKTAEKELKTYAPIKTLGGVDEVIKKMKSQKAEIHSLKKQSKKTNSGPKTTVAAINSVGVKGRNQFVKASYSQLESAYKDLDRLFKSTEAKLVDCQFILAQQEGLVSVYSFKEDYLFTFPNLLVLGTKKDDKDDAYSEKQMHRTLLYISNHGVGGLLYLDDDDVVQIMHDGEKEAVQPKNNATMIFAKAWLKKLKNQRGKLQEEDLNLAEFLTGNRKSLPKLLNKEEIKHLPKLERNRGISAAVH